MNKTLIAVYVIASLGCNEIRQPVKIFRSSEVNRIAERGAEFAPEGYGVIALDPAEAAASGFMDGNPGRVPADKIKTFFDRIDLPPVAVREIRYCYFQSRGETAIPREVALYVFDLADHKTAGELRQSLEKDTRGCIYRFFAPEPGNAHLIWMWCKHPSDVAAMDAILDGIKNSLIR